MTPKGVAGAIIPLVLLVVLVWYIIGPGSDALIMGTLLPDIILERVSFVDSEIQVVVRNTGPIPVSIVQGDVNDRIQPAAVEPDGHLERFETALVRIPYEWNEAEPYNIGITIQDGTRFDRDIEAAFPAITYDIQQVGLLAQAGLAVGVIPIFIGLLWLPFIRRLSAVNRGFFLALTIGLLVFLAVESAEEALAVSAENLAETMNGGLLVLVSASAAFLALQYAGNRMGGAGKTQIGMAAALMTAVGIGLHNFSEGLALGAALNVGAVAFSTYLMAGFAIHNTTEGIAIAAPISDKRRIAAKLVGLGLIAGTPAIFGAWTGSFFYSPIASVIFLAVGAGAILQVVLSIYKWIIPDMKTLATPQIAGGLLAGLLIMYVTGIVI